MKNFKKLNVWIKAMEIVKKVYELVSDFPDKVRNELAAYYIDENQTMLRYFIKRIES